MHKRYLYHKEHKYLYAYNALAAEQVREGFNTDLVLIDADDERVATAVNAPADAKPKARKAVRPEPVELDASVLDSASK